MNNEIKIPQFSYMLDSPQHKNHKCIMSNKVAIGTINDEYEFYQMFGYTIETARAGVLPNEFIWSEYIQKPDFNACIQMHIIGYLNKFSSKFRELHSSHFNEFIKDHAQKRKSEVTKCFACKLKPICEYDTFN